MALEIEAHLSGRLADILSGRLNTGTPQWVLEKTKGMRFSNGENVLFLTGLLPVSSAEPKRKLERSITLDPSQLFWSPEPPSSRGSSRKVNLFDREDYFGYRPPSTTRGSARSSVEPRASTKPAEYEQWERSVGDTKLHTCLSQRLFSDCVKRPQLYPVHATGFNGESMHSFITGSKYNRKNYTSPHHLQLFDYYSPPIRPEYIESKYKRFRRRNTQCRVLSSETEFTSRLKSPLPKEATAGEQQVSTRPTSSRSSYTTSTLTPRRPSTQQGSKVNPARTAVRRLNSAPLSGGHSRRISHLQGFTKEVFDKALSKHAPRYVMSSGSAYTPRPQSSGASSMKSRSAVFSEGNSDCVICQSPDIWKAYVESQQQNNDQQPVENEVRPATADFSAQSDVERALDGNQNDGREQLEPSAVSGFNKEAASLETPVKVEETETTGENKSFIRVFATEPVLDIDDEDVEVSEGLSRQAPGSVTGVEIIVREKPLTNQNEGTSSQSDHDNHRMLGQAKVTKDGDGNNESVIIINEESLLNETENELQLEVNLNQNDNADLNVFGTRHLSSPEISFDNNN